MPKSPATATSNELLCRPISPPIGLPEPIDEGWAQMHRIEAAGDLSTAMPKNMLSTGRRKRSGMKPEQPLLKQS